jgi:signal transduction histidine kinase
VADLTPSRFRVPPALVGLGVWTAIALAFVTSNYAMYAIKDEPQAWWKIVFWGATEWYLFAAFSPLVFRFVRRHPLTGHDWPRRIPAYIAVWLLLQVAIQVLYVMAERSIGLAGTLAGMEPHRHVLLYVTKRAAFSILVFAGMVAAAHATMLYRRYRERELRSAQLETQLARAELQSLRTQLQPHFLFNTLNTISALVHRDPDGAERVVSRLGDLLRLSLHTASRSEVALRRELEFLDGYIEIQQTRFRDRLTVTIDADPDALDAVVPSLMLQPLVENAIRHGIEPRAAPGQVLVRAWCSGSRLTITVSDDGIGVPEQGSPSPTAGNGVGLRNTRARLRQLYGTDHTFSVGPSPDGGTIVLLEIPYRVAVTVTPAPLDETAGV